MVIKICINCIAVYTYDIVGRLSFRISAIHRSSPPREKRVHAAAYSQEMGLLTFDRTKVFLQFTLLTILLMDLLKSANVPNQRTMRLLWIYSYLKISEKQQEVGITCKNFENRRSYSWFRFS